MNCFQFRSDMDKLMTMGKKNRSIGATQMNAHSSRSHAIFSITVECSEKGPDGQQHFRYIQGSVEEKFP